MRTVFDQRTETSYLRDATVINLETVRQGPKGKQGDAGIGVAGGGLKFSVSFGDVAQRVLYTMPSAGRVQSVSLDIDTAWNGAGSVLSVGALTPTVELMTAIENDPYWIAIYETSPGVSLSAGEQIYFFNSPGAGCTQGAGVVVLDIIFD